MLVYYFNMCPSLEDNINIIFTNHLYFWNTLIHIDLIRLHIRMHSARVIFIEDMLFFHLDANSLIM